MFDTMLPLFAACFVVFAIFAIKHLYIDRESKGGRAASLGASGKDSTGSDDLYQDIEPLSGNVWDTEAPIKMRPFKPKYHLTMGLETIKIQDLVEVDRTYKERIDLRRQLMDTHPIATLAARPGSDEMVHEFYAWMMGTYLPSRWPSMYSLSPAKSTPPTHLHNLATHEEIPLESRSTLDALRTLGAHVDTDFLFMLPSPNDGKYHLEAFVNCFPAGFSTREKLGLPLAAIHAPVPGYAAKLEKSMDRFFANLPLGKLVKRANWSLTTTAELFLESGNHLYDEKQSTKSEVNHGPGTESERNSESELAQLRAGVNIPDCRLRCERQTLHRLPKTNALVFAFKTYQYTLPELKEEGSGQELADAIDGLTKGNVPEMAYYKRGVVWGDKVKEYLTS